MLGGGGPSAANVLTGVLGSTRFAVFDYRQAGGDMETAFAVPLGAPVPHLLIVAVGDRVGKASSAAALERAGDRLGSRLAEHPGRFPADGGWVTTTNEGFLSPTLATVEKQVAALAAVAPVLTAVLADLGRNATTP